MDDEESAVKELNIAVDLDPTHRAANEALLEHCKAAGDHNGVLSALVREEGYLEETGDKVAKLIDIADLQMGDLEDKNGAVVSLERAKDLDPANTTVLLKLSDAYTNDGREDDAIPVIEALAHEIEVPISIDTVKSGVARAALAAGASIINDISSFEKDPAMADLAAETGAPAILMHMKGTPETMQIHPSYDDLMGEITTYLQSRIDFALERGVSRDKIILDPGIGFGKTVAHNLVLIKELSRLTALGFPVLMGPSRKSFIQNILTETTPKEAGPGDPRTEYGTLAACAASLMNGAHIIRVHDVNSVFAFTRIIDAVRNA